MLLCCPKTRLKISVEFIFQIFNPSLDYFPFTFRYINPAKKLNNLKLISSTSLSISIDKETRIYNPVLELDILKNVKEANKNG